MTMIILVLAGCLSAAQADGELLNGGDVTVHSVWPDTDQQANSRIFYGGRFSVANGLYSDWVSVDVFLCRDKLLRVDNRLRHWPDYNQIVSPKQSVTIKIGPLGRSTFIVSTRMPTLLMPGRYWVVGRASYYVTHDDREFYGQVWVEFRECCRMRRMFDVHPDTTQDFKVENWSREYDESLHRLQPPTVQQPLSLVTETNVGVEMIEGGFIQPVDDGYTPEADLADSGTTPLY